MGWKWLTALINPSKELSQLRTYLRKSTGPQAMVAYRPAIIAEASNMLKQMLSFSGDPAELLHSYVSLQYLGDLSYLLLVSLAPSFFVAVTATNTILSMGRSS